MTLAEIIATRIRPATVERVVFDHGRLSEAQRNDIFKQPNLSPLAIAEKLVDAYGTQPDQLAKRLHQQVADTDWATANELAVHFRAGYDNNQQASLVARIPTVSLGKLSEFLDSVRRHICLIVSKDGNTGKIERGTGFLVAPELVLTCQHVLRNFPKGQAATGSQIDVYFDFMQGDEVDRVGLMPPDARKVALAEKWHVESCDGTDPDGVEGDLTPDEITRISNSLDFILLRLAEPVGLQPMSRGGGRRRGWISFPSTNVAKVLAMQDWIIIPQHPGGLPQRIDLGQFKEPDQTSTRIRYDTNTAPGTSGAPCFNQNFDLVGVHNARVGPEAAPKGNQAIRWDLVEARVKAHVQVAQAVSYAKLWSISRDGEPHRVILGREAFLDWLRASAVAEPKTLAERVYAAQANVPEGGCSFSVDVLHAEMRASKVPRAVYGDRGNQQLPSTPEDFLTSLIGELGIDPEVLKTMPSRPGASDATTGLPLLGGEVDKLDRWIADELPAWLGRVINTHLDRQIDAREAARQVVEGMRLLGQQPPAEVVKNSEAPNPILKRVNLWDFAYIVIDDLRVAGFPAGKPRSNLQGEVLSLVAALVKGKPEAAMPTGLRRLRWMFLGYLPDFIEKATADGNGATLETLDPGKVEAAQVVEMFWRMSEAKLPIQEWNQNWAQASAQAVILLADLQPIAAPRLSRLQQNAGVFATQLLSVIGH
jgi:hypothetical protein